nr:MAG TPA: hypothetical protein [Caudoviricetes sp.]
MSSAFLKIFKFALNACFECDIFLIGRGEELEYW